MKRLLLAGVGLVALGIAVPASAADMPVRRGAVAPIAVAPVYNWTGFYIGAHVGYGWSDKDWAFVGSGLSTSHSPDGFLGGGQIGFNWQMGALVLGVEGQLSWADLSGSSACPGAGFTCHTNVDMLGSLALRVGFAAANWLLYVKGGFAWIDEDFRAVSGATVFTGDRSEAGWMLGVGVEYGFTPNWSAKLEYNYMDFDSDRITFTGPGGVTDNFDVSQQVHVVKFGINYRFGGKGPVPVTARY